MTPGITDLGTLLKTMTPVLHAGEYTFCTVTDMAAIPLNDMICFFREEEAIAVIVPRQLADTLELPYSFVAAWITLTVHSSLEAVGLTAAFSAALSAQNISCNVVAAYYHDHIFVAREDAEKAMQILQQLSA
jgi:uncharacterized protein